MQAPTGMGGPSPVPGRRMEHQRVGSFGIFFLSGKFVILTETNARGKKYSSEETEAPSSVNLTSKWKIEQLVKRGKKKKIAFPQNH